MITDEAAIAFIFPPYATDYEFRYHLGVGYIQAHLDEKGIYSVQYVPKIAKAPSQVIDDVLKLRPEFIGFTCYDSNYYIVKSLAHLFKMKRPEIPIVIGGPTATFSDSLVLEDCHDCDMCVRGEGEETTLELIRTNVKNLENIKGISFRSHGSLYRTEDRPLMRSNEKGSELDIFSSPYLKDILPLDGKAGILTSRGCTYSCVYCNFSAMSRHTVRYHSVDRVIAELRKIDEHVSKTGKKQMVDIFDDTFSLNRERAKEICRRIIEENMSLEFYIDTRADACDIELLQLMKQARLKSVNFGLESAVPRILRNIKKVYASGDSLNHEPEERFLNAIKQNVELAKKLGFYVTVSVILGLPNETLEDAEETLKFVKELGVDDYTHNYLNIFAGTELFETHKQYGYEISRSDTILPLRTMYPYNAYSLRPLPNANLYAYIRADEKNYLEILANSGANGTENLNVFVDLVPEMSTFCSWLSNYGTLPFTLFIMNPRMTVNDLGTQIKEFVEHGAPIGKLFFINRESSAARGNSYALAGAFISTVHLPPISRFVEAPLSEQHRISPSKGVRSIFTVSTKEDVKNLSELVKESADSGRITIKYPFRVCGIRDECKWSAEPCPATIVRRIIINSDGAIRTCFDGTPVGNLASDGKKTKTQLETLQTETISRRRCDFCSVKQICSKCLFPSPLTEEEYCSLRRQLPEISGFIELLGIIRTFSDGKLMKNARIETVSINLKTFMQMKSCKSEKTKIRTNPSTRLVNVNGVPYVLNRKDGKIFRLNPLTSEILEWIIFAKDTDKLVTKLQERFKISRNEVREQVSKAVQLFVEKGLLEGPEDMALSP
jgi:radical SAM superfamily enzyme YgiQ (UPF0313 family)